MSLLKSCMSSMNPRTPFYKETHSLSNHVKLACDKHIAFETLARLAKIHLYVEKPSKCSPKVHVQPACIQISNNPLPMPINSK